MVRKQVIIGAMSPLKRTEYDDINFLIATPRYTVRLRLPESNPKNNATTTPPQSEINNSRLTLANDLWDPEKHHRQLASQAASGLNAVYDNLESTISFLSPKERISPVPKALSTFFALAFRWHFLGDTTPKLNQKTLGKPAWAFKYLEQYH